MDLFVHMFLLCNKMETARFYVHGKKVLEVPIQDRWLLDSIKEFTRKDGNVAIQTLCKETSEVSETHPQFDAIWKANDLAVRTMLVLETIHGPSIWKY